MTVCMSCSMPMMAGGGVKSGKNPPKKCKKCKGACTCICNCKVKGACKKANTKKPSTKK